MVRRRQPSTGAPSPNAPSPNAPSPNAPSTGAPPAKAPSPSAERVPVAGAGTIRGRLARILALPMVAVLVLLAVVVAGNLSDYRAAKRTTGSVALELQLQILAEELQQERGLTSGLLGGDVGFGVELDPERRQVDAQRDRVAGLTVGDGQGLAAVRAALAQLDGLTGIRAQVDAKRVTRNAAFQFYTARIASLNGVDLGLGDSADRTLRRGIASLLALGQIQEYLTQERAFLNGVFSAGGFQTGEYPRFVAMYAGLQQAEQQFGVSATPAQIAVAEAVQSSGPYSEAQTFEARALASADGRVLLVDPQSWWSALTPVLDELLGLEHSVGADITHRARALQSGATRRLTALGGLVVLCLIGALALVIAAARSITGPLAALAAEAEALASRRLPEAVARVQTGTDEEQPAAPPALRVSPRASSEIRSVAAALERVQATAFTLATEQALLRRNTTESLANLGRRNQNLLRRQLGFITRLESEETDPSGLANLFELDHLATRMRRNAESLLVLVGEATPRTWAGAMPVADVIRAAISEVEEYRRVTLRRIDDGYIAGAFVTGVAHMIAELVENGLTFSPPDVDVEIQGRQIGNQYLIAITDQGIGMEAAELASANARLRGEEHFLMAPARFLGHYVVGQLARQMSLDVQLSPSPVTGVTARVVLPARVLAPAPGIGSGPSGGNGTGERPVVVPMSTVDAPRPSAGSAAGVPVGSAAGSPIGSGAASPGGRPTPGGRATAPTSRPLAPPATVASQLAIGLRPEPGVEYGTAMRPDSRSVDGSTFDSGAADATGVGVPTGDAIPADAAAGAPGVGVLDVDPLDIDVLPAGGPAPGDPDGSDRTRNGLLKRPRRARVERADPTVVLPRVGAVADAAEPARPAALDESPAQVRDRLVSLRAGVQRGESERDGNGEGRS